MFRRTQPSKHGIKAEKWTRRTADTIDILDLGSGGDFERLSKMAQRARVSKDSKALKPRRIVALDKDSPKKKVEGVEYVQQDATEFLKGRPAASVKVVNSDNFFSIHAANKNPDWAPHAMKRFTLNTPIDPELLDEIVRAVPRRGRVYHTGVKWANDSLTEKLRQRGFTVSSRPLTDTEALEGPRTTRVYHKAWKNGEFFEWFGRAGWRLHRVEAIKK